MVKVREAAETAKHIFTTLQNFFPKLTRHLLPHLKEAVQEHTLLGSLHLHPGTSEPAVPSAESIVFKYNCLYRYNLMCVNYTTYDVRQAQDTISVNTVKHDIMILPRADLESCDLEISFTHARVLGIFHVNAVYIGASLPSYLPVRLEFLWVRWFQ